MALKKLPDKVHTLAGAELYVTGKPELAVAINVVTVDGFIAGSGLKLIVWLAKLTARVLFTLAAAA